MVGVRGGWGRGQASRWAGGGGLGSWSVTRRKLQTPGIAEEHKR